MFEKAKDDEYKQLIDEILLRTVHQNKNLRREANLVGFIYTFNIKHNESTGAKERCRARFGALGNQRKLDSNDRIISSTARGKSIKLMMPLQAKTGAKSMVLDVKGVYLKTEIKD